MKKTLKLLTQYLRKKSKKQSLLNEYICADRLSYNNFYERPKASHEKLYRDCKCS